MQKLFEMLTWILGDFSVHFDKDSQSFIIDVFNVCVGVVFQCASQDLVLYILWKAFCKNRLCVK